jgi:hypothetical protein
MIDLRSDRRAQDALSQRLRPYFARSKAVKILSNEGCIAFGLPYRFRHSPAARDADEPTNLSWLLWLPSPALPAPYLPAHTSDTTNTSRL